MFGKKVFCFVSVFIVFVGALPAFGESEQWETAVSASNPLNWYKLNETGGTIATDYGSAGVDGTYGDAVELNQAGFVGTGAYLGGTGSGIKIVYLHQEKVTGDWTAEFILIAKSLPTESILLSEDVWGFIKLSQTMDFAGQVGYTRRGVYDAGLGYYLPLNEFHHLVFVMTEEEGMKLYVDGILEGSAGSYLEMVRQHLGGQETRDGMDGIVDEAVLYSRALTQDEIEAHADAAFGVVRPRAVVNPTMFVIAEPGSDSYSVVISSEISSDVEVIVDPNIHGELVAVSSGGQDPGYGERITLTFTPSDWDQEQIVGIRSLDDSVNMGLNTAIIKHLVSSSDPNVRDRAMDVSVTLKDDDSTECLEAVFSDDFNDGILDGGKWVRVDSRVSARGLLESQNVLSTASGSYAMAVGEWPVFRMTGMASPYDGTIGMFVRSDGSAETGVRLEFWAGGIGSEWQENVLTIMSGDKSVTYANMAWPGEKFDYSNTNFYWEVLDDGLTISFTVEELGESSNRATISVDLPGVGDGTQILIGCDEWGSSGDCWYDDVCIFTYPVSVEESGIPAKTVVFENSLSGPAIDDYTISLEEAPGSAVTITATVMDPNTEPGYVGNLVTLREQSNPGNAGYSIDVFLDTGNWQDGVVIEVVAIDDVSVEIGSHIAAVVHSAQSDDVDFDGAFVPAVNVIIYDDDAPYVLVDEMDGVEVSEADTLHGDSYSVRLLGEPSSEVSVGVVADVEQVLVTPGELPFTVDEWWAVQAVQVTAVDDELSGEFAEGDPHSTTVSHTVSGADEYADLDVDSVTVSILDNDCGSWSYEPMDFDLDCDVDVNDFAEFAERWMACTMPHAPGCVRIE